MLFRIEFLRAALVGLAAMLLAGPAGWGAEATGAQVQELIEQNRRLQEQVRAQQQTIDALTTKIGEVQRASERHDRELRGLQDRMESPRAATPAGSGNRENEVRISAEAGLAFFNTGTAGQFPKAEFRVDDPVIAIEAPVLKDIYFFTDLRLLTRETNTENFQLGELYVDFENVSGHWGQPGLLSLRAGRVNIPFGEEYAVRGPVANPLISHSLTDIWGTDEGVEIYGKIGPANYVLAVQNGGTSRLRDFNADKAVAGRVSWDPARWLHVSASAMRTGELGAASGSDFLSEVWFANGFFRSIGGATTTSFWANLVEADASTRWHGGHLSAALGQARYNDNDRRAANARRMRYGYVEAMQSIAGGLYAAARFSRVSAPRGYPLAGWGNMGRFFFAPSLTEELRRFSLGLGYQFGPPLVLKMEYAWESGRMVNKAPRDHEDFFGTELGVKF
jgi:hypothetical protein